MVLLHERPGVDSILPLVAVAKCSKSCDLIAIAICDSNRESQITRDFETVGGGAGLATSTWSPLETALVHFCFFGIVSVKWRYLLATLYSDGCLSFCLPDVMVVCQPSREERAKCQTTTLGVIVRYSPLMCKSLRFWGRFSWWGGLRV